MFPFRPLAPKAADQHGLPDTSRGLSSNIPKQRRHHHTNEDWEARKAAVLRLYIDEKKKAEDVVRILTAQFDFKASRRQLFNKLREWGVEKNGRRRRGAIGHVPYAGVPRAPSCNPIARSLSAVPALYHSQSSPLPFQSPANHFNPHSSGEGQYLEYFESLLDPPHTRTPRGSPVPDVTAWGEVTLRTSTPPPAPFRPWSKLLPWIQFQSSWLLPAFDHMCQFNCSDTSNIIKIVESSRPLRAAWAPEAESSLQVNYSEAYLMLSRLMPELFDQENVLRAQAITRHLGDAACIASSQELLLFFASNNITIDYNSRKMDEAILEITEYLLRIKAPLVRLVSATEPTAHALAGRIFASAVRLMRVDLLRRLKCSGFDLHSWARRQIPFSYLLYHVVAPGTNSALPLHVALSQYDLELAKFLLGNGAHINDYTMGDSRRASGMLRAAIRGYKMATFRPDVLQFVLQYPEANFTESQINDELAFMECGHSYGNYTREAAALLLDCVEKLRESRGLMSPTRVLSYAIRYSHQSLIDAILLDWKPQDGLEGSGGMSINAPLLEAVYRGNYRVCEVLLDAGMSQHAEDDYSPSALHLATHRGYVDIMRLLIARGASLNHCNRGPEDYDGWLQDGPFLRLCGTPLTCAIRDNQEQAFNFLLETGATCTTADLIGAIRSCEDGDTYIVDALVMAGLQIPNKTEDGESILAMAIRSKNELLVNHIIKNVSTGYDAEALLEAVYTELTKELIEETEVQDRPLVAHLLRQREKHTDRERYTAFAESLILAMAVWWEDQVLASQLTEHGFVFRSDLGHYLGEDPDETYLGRFSRHSGWVLADDHTLMRDGCSLIGVASLGNQETQDAMLDLLLSLGHRPCVVDFHCAFLNRGWESGLMKLLQSPRFVEETRAEWPTYLPRAIDCSMASVVQFLLDKGTNVNAFSPSYSHLYIVPSRTALQTASTKGDMILMKSLIQRGANVNALASNRRGATALQYAVMHGFIGAVKLLIEEEADVNALGATFHGRTALEAAGEHGRIDTIQLLLLAGAETTGRGQLQYLKAVRFAEDEGHHAAAQLLRGHRAWTEEDHAIWREIVLYKDESESSDGCSDSGDENSDCGSETDSEPEIGSRSNHDSNMEISDGWGGLREYNTQEL